MDRPQVPMSCRPIRAVCPIVPSQNPPRRQNGEWLDSCSVLKQRTSNPVPLSTASTAASSPRVRATHSPPPGFCDPPSHPSAMRTGLLMNPSSGVLFGDFPPSPGLVKRLLAQAHVRKRAGRHNLVSSSQCSIIGGSAKRILRLSAPNTVAQKDPVDRWGIPDDLFNSLTAQAARVKKLSGQHRLERRRIGLSGEVEHVLVMTSSVTSTLGGRNPITHHTPPTCTVSMFSPDPALF